MKTAKTIAMLVVVGIVLALGGAAQAELVGNGGFESNSGNGSTPANWTKDFNSYGAFDGAAHAGSYGLHPGAGAGTGGEYQDITTVAGQTYDVSLWGQNFAGGAGSSHVKVLVGSAGTDTYAVDDFGQNTTMFSTTGLLDQTFPTAGDGSWTNATFQFTAGGTATRFGVYNSWLTGDSVHSINVDDVSLTAAPKPDDVIPEPCTMLALLAGAAGLGGYVRRRRGTFPRRIRMKAAKTIAMLVVVGVILTLGGAAQGLSVYPRLEGDLTDSNSIHDLSVSAGGHTFQADVPWSQVPQTGAPNTQSAHLTADARLMFANPQTFFNDANVDAMTVEFSFKADALSGHRQMVYQHNNWGVRLADSKVVGYLWDKPDVNSAINVVPGRWYDVAFTADGSEHKLYIRRQSGRQQQRQ